MAATQGFRNAHAQGFKVRRGTSTAAWPEGPERPEDTQRAGEEEGRNKAPSQGVQKAVGNKEYGVRK
ncbi:hypothetical protein E5D57_006425 [Metarhizium anisopliae]|nr:hypothetical protein E5D57_006425 [Metarhizium anisopliae]